MNKTYQAPKLSILLPGLRRRKVFHTMLFPFITSQAEGKPVEILYDNDGQVSIGKKRDRMLYQATGDYIVFIDDDDLVSDNYVDLVLGALEEGPDCVGIHLLHYVDSNLLGKTYHSLKYSHWYDEPDPERPGGMLFYRNPNHLNPVKRDIALRVGFPDLAFGEDREYSMGIFPYLKTEVYIEPPIYFYHERGKKEV